MNYDRLVLGYHGCRASDADAILEGSDFRASNNAYDWLGSGVYFWEHGPHRAQRFIEEKLKREHCTAASSVVGALIQLGSCFDLLDTGNTQKLRDGYPEFVASFKSANKPLPINGGDAPEHKLRYLDCAMMDFYLSQSDEHRSAPYQTVRGCFLEGEAAFPGSGFQTEAHIQIAVRDPTCILGTFRPRMEQ